MACSLKPIVLRSVVKELLPSVVASLTASPITVTVDSSDASFDGACEAFSLLCEVEGLSGLLGLSCAVASSGVRTKAQFMEPIATASALFCSDDLCMEMIPFALCVFEI